MKKLALLLSGLLVIHASQVIAQMSAPTPRPTPPAGPYIQKRAPEFSSWVVSTQDPGVGGSTGTNKSPSASGSSGDSLARRTGFSVTKTGKIYHISLVDRQGQNWNLWSDGKLVAHVPPNGGDAMFITPPDRPYITNPLYLTFPNSDFEGFDWISAANFQEVRDVMGQQCLVFSGTVKVVSTEADRTGEWFDSRVACVNAETRLPVSLSDANGVKIFKFLAPPMAMQTLPEGMLKMINKKLHAEEQLAKLPAKPY